MASPPLIAVICSDRHRNGKTLLARVLVDFLLLEGRDPFVPRSQPPGGNAARVISRAARRLSISTMVAGQMKVFDTILAGPGRDYVIDLPAQQLPRFCEAMRDLEFRKAYEAAGFSFVLSSSSSMPTRNSLKTAAAVEELLTPDLFVPVANRFVGSALPDGVPGLGPHHGEARSRSPRHHHPQALFVPQFPAGRGIRRAVAPEIQSQDLPAHCCFDGFREIEPALNPVNPQP